MSDLTDAYQQIWDGQLSCYDPEAITIAEVSYACEGGLLNQSNEAELGGLVEMPTTRVSIKRSLFADGAVPEEKTAATYRGLGFKIHRISSSPDNTVLHLDLEPLK